MSIVGQTLGQYEVQEEIGHGGNATVYRATHVNLKTEVALKVLKPTYAKDGSTRQRFIQEARAVSQLKHPHIIEILDLDENDQQVFIAMQYVRGCNLSEWREKRPDLLWQEVFELLKQIASALDYAHQQNILHRDVKPNNILIDERTNKAILTDFGLIRVLNTPRETRVGDVVGTPTYLSPEQANDDPLDGRTDQYSLAVIAYQFLVGMPPFLADNSTALALKHIKETPPIPSAQNAGVPPEIDDVLLQALQKNPHDRYETCVAFISALETAYTSSQQRRYRTFLEQAKQLLAQGKYEEGQQVLEQATQLLPHRLDAKTALEELQKEKELIRVYQDAAKKLSIAKQQAYNVLELVPDYPDEKRIFIKLKLRAAPRLQLTKQEWVQQLVIGVTVGLSSALLILFLFFRWITRELPPETNRSPELTIFFWSVTLMIVGYGFWRWRRLHSSK